MDNCPHLEKTIDLINTSNRMDTIIEITNKIKTLKIKTSLISKDPITNINKSTNNPLITITKEPTSTTVAKCEALAPTIV